MLKQLRQTLINNIWVKFHNENAQIKLIVEGLHQRGIENIYLDHFAIIDLPGPNSGIDQLSQIFSAIGYIVQGRDYLAAKQNDFLWLTEVDSKHAHAKDVLPQVVVADFRLDEMPIEIKKIIEKYAQQVPPSPLAKIQNLVGKTFLNNFHAAKELSDLIENYLQGRDWHLPLKSEFLQVKEFNELLAWVLVFGRRPNHFTLSIHLLNKFNNLFEFHTFIENNLHLELNAEGGKIKGNAHVGIEQGATQSPKQEIKFADGKMEIATPFVEFVWRFPHHASTTPIYWEDYFTGFIPQHADNVIESLYTSKQKIKFGFLTTA